MAILTSYLPLLDACHRRQGIVSPVVALGSQQIPDPPAFLSAWATERGYATMAADPSTATLFRDRYGIAEYRDVDLNDDADIRLDLSAPLPAELRGTAGTVLDGGTIEHIADLRTVLENIHLLLRPGGTFIGFLPSPGGSTASSTSTHASSARSRPRTAGSRSPRASGSGCGCRSWASASTP